MSRKSAVKSTSINVKQTDDGLHLTDTILWFDSQKTGELSFLSSASKAFKTSPQQVIATEETVKILEAIRRKPSALICQYNRPFSIGRLKMELLPSGCILGGASLFVETDDGSLLYAPHLQTHRIPTVRQMQLKKANTLILGPSHPDPNANPGSRKKEKERLVERVSKLVGWKEPPVVLCDPIGQAQELTQLFSEAGLPVAVHESIFRINRAYEAFGANIGDYTRYSKYTRQKISLMPMPKGPMAARQGSHPEGPLIVVESTFDEVKAQIISPKAPIERFFLSNQSDASELKDIIDSVSPKELYVFGPYAKRYVVEWEGLCPSIKPLFPNDQPTLF
jgi:Cft2 family RNA processing exonuclease